MKKNHFISGEWNLICDVCSKKIKAHEAKQRWDGFIVCPDDYEMRQPQDFVKAHTDKITVPFTRPRPPDVFVDDGNRSVSDIITLTELMSIQTSPNFADMIGFDDLGQDYISPTYFLEDYIESTSLMITVIKALSDSINTAETGSIFFNDYIDSTYFAEDYVGTVTTF